jgi:two-component system, NtrC family, sensor kinase
MQAEADEFPMGSNLARHLGFRTMLSVPLMREGVAIGTIMVRRTEARLFTERQVALLQTFADQAVIAVENVRLFTETKERLEQQTATSEILQVISRSPTDVQPVFETILERAVALCGARNGSLFRFDGELVHVAAHFNLPSTVVEIIARQFPSPPNPRTASGRTILGRRVITIEDVLADEN